MSAFQTCVCVIFTNILLAQSSSLLELALPVCKSLLLNIQKLCESDIISLVDWGLKNQISTHCKSGLVFIPKELVHYWPKASHMAEVRVKGLARVTRPEGKGSIQLHGKTSGSGSGEELGPIFTIDHRYSTMPEKLSSFPGSTECGTSQVTFYCYLFIFLLVRSLEVSCWFFILANLPLLIKIHVILDVKRTL